MEDKTAATAATVISEANAIGAQAKAIGAQAKALEAEAKSIIDLLKDFLNILRDVVLLGLFALLILAPATFQAMLNRAGIQELDGGFFKWQRQAVAEAAAQNKTAATASSSASISMTDVQSALDTIAKTSTNPAIKKQAQDAAQQVGQSLANLSITNDSLAHSLVAQQSVLDRSNQSAASATTAATPAASDGWIYLGKVDATHANWMTPPRIAASLASPKLTAGQTITLGQDATLHDNKAAGQTSFNQASVLGAVSGGSTVTVQGFDYSSALGGGDFLWAKVAIDKAR